MFVLLVERMNWADDHRALPASIRLRNGMGHFIRRLDFAARWRL
jgi:hypothetical protein